jgi:EmrB/QacA subfamily drug resistance transporter
MARKWWTLTAVCVATFMLILDVTIVNVALPSIREDLGSSFTDLQWIVDAYALTLAAFVLTGGSLADQLGRRRVFVVGLVVFTTASAFCALAGSPLTLNLARAVQGSGAAVMFAVSLALLGQEFRGRERANATAVYGAAIGAAILAGPLLGGALTDSLGWEAIFWINVPIGIATIAITLTRVAESRDPEALGIDWIGLITFSLANALLIFGLIRANVDGWTSDTVVGSLGGAAGLFLVFVGAQLRAANPMLPLGLFRNRAFTGAQIGAFAISASMFALFLYLTLYVQNLLGYSALEAGLIYMPGTVVSLVFSGVTAALMGRVPLRVLLSSGLVILGAGLAIIASPEEGDRWTSLLPGFLLTGIGVGVINPVIANLALSTAPDAQGGVASGINDTFRQVGIATGVAALGALLLSRAAATIQDLLPGTGHDEARRLAEGVSSGALPSGLPDAVVHAARQGFLDGLGDAILVGCVTALIGAVLCAWLVRPQDIRVDDAGAADPQPPRP